jgi:hypothetical protein
MENTGSQDSSCGIVTWLWVGRPSNRGSIPDTGKILFSPQQCSRLALGHTKPFIHRLFPGVERLGRETDHSPLSSSEVKNASIHPYSVMTWNEIKHRDGFIFITGNT